VEEGDKLPENLEFITTEGKIVTGKDLSEGLVILYFYPGALTPGCTREGVRFNELYQEFERCGAQIYGASTDPPEKNKKFKEKYSFKFELLSDPEGRNASILGILKKGTKKPKAQRVTFIVKDGAIAKILKNIRPAEKHADEALSVVKKLVEC
jgi:peroxiredoxin Q/BCP